MRRVVVATGLVIVLGAIASLVVVVWGDDTPQRSAPRESVSGPNPTAPPPPATIPGAAVTSFELEGDYASLAGPIGGQPIAVGGGAVWLSTRGGVVRVDSATGATTPVVSSDSMYYAYYLTFGDEGLWVLDSEDCLRSGIPGVPSRLRLVSAHTYLAVRTIPVSKSCKGSDLGYKPVLASAPGSVWILDGPAVIRVDTRSGESITIPLSSVGLPVGGRSGDCGAALAADESGVWIGCYSTLRHISAATNTIDSEISLGDRLVNYRMAIVEGSLWVSTHSSTFQLVRVDGASVAAVEVPGAVLAFAIGNELWFAGYFPNGESDAEHPRTVRVGQVDPRSGQITRVVDLDTPNLGFWGGETGEGALWLELTTGPQSSRLVRVNST